MSPTRHTLPRRMGRYGYPGFQGLLEHSPRQRYIMEASLARYRERHGEPPPLIRGEVGAFQGIRITPSRVQWVEPWISRQPDQAAAWDLLVEDAMLTGTMMYRTAPDGTVTRIPPPSARR